MNARITKKGIKISDIFNEGMFDYINMLAKDAKCEVTYSNEMTLALVTGSSENLNSFINMWND